MDNKIVGIIDDDPSFQFILKQTIRLISPTTEVRVFNNGKEALDHFVSMTDNPEGLPDVILVDLNMPVMNGWELIENISQLPEDVKTHFKTYILTSSIFQSDVKKSKQYNFISDYLFKPVDEDVMKEILFH